MSYSSRAHEVGAIRVQGFSKPGLGREVMNLGGNSGYQSLNLAYLWGAKWVGLLGFDMQATGGESHWHGDHPAKCRGGNPQFTQWLKNFDVLASDLVNEGVKVFNFSRETALNCFERRHIEGLK